MPHIYHVKLAPVAPKVYPPGPKRDTPLPATPSTRVADVYRKDPQHRPNWMPGMWGKGILFRNGEVHTWNTGTNGGTYPEADGKPYHVDYLMNVLKNEPPTKPEQFFSIDPEGKASYSPIYDEFVRDAHPEITRRPSNWEFNAAALPVQNGGHHFKAYNKTTSPWELGGEGKGILLKDGLHMWDPYGEIDPHHDGIYDAVRGEYVEGGEGAWRKHYQEYYDAPKFYIRTDGAVDIAIGSGSEQLPQILKMHPDLKDEASEDEWSFTSGVMIENTWQRAKWGKGLITPEGDGYFWAVDNGGYPHHHEYNENVLQLGDLYYSSIPLLIKPNGVVDIYAYPTETDRGSVEHIVKLFGKEWPRYMKPGSIGSFYQDNKIENPYKLPNPDEWLFNEAHVAGESYDEAVEIQLGYQGHEQPHKGLAYPDGSVKMWPVDDYGSPHHEDADDGEQQPSKFFVVRDGVATNAYDQGADENKTGLEPWQGEFDKHGIMLDTEGEFDTDWRFGTATSDEWWDKHDPEGKFRPKPATPAATTPATFSEHEYDTPGYMPSNRRPVLYNAAENHVYVGPHNAHHDGLYEQMGDDWDPYDVVSGIMFKEKDGSDKLRFWQDEQVPYPQAAADALKAQYGVDDQRRDDEDEWQFESAVDDDYVNDYLPKVTVHPYDEDHMTKMYGYEGRKPIIYDPTNNHLHVGYDEEAHFNLCDRLADGDDTERTRLYNTGHQGWLGDNPESEHDDHVQNAGQPNEYGWYGEHPGSHVDDALTTHFNASLDTNDEWHFGASGAIKVMQVTDPATMVDEDMMTRRPIIWDQSTQTVYVGQPGWHHAGIEYNQRIPDHGLCYGWIGDGEAGRSNEYGEVGWYNHARPQDDEIQAIHSALEQELGVKTTDVSSAPDDWHFGAWFKRKPKTDPFNMNPPYIRGVIMKNDHSIHSWDTNETKEYHVDWFDHNGVKPKDAISWRTNPFENPVTIEIDEQQDKHAPALLKHMQEQWGMMPKVREGWDGWGEKFDPDENAFTSAARRFRKPKVTNQVDSSKRTSNAVDELRSFIQDFNKVPQSDIGSEIQDGREGTSDDSASGEGGNPDPASNGDAELQPVSSLRDRRTSAQDAEMGRSKELGSEWEPGYRGKWLIDHNDKVRAWTVGTLGGPHHGTWAREIGGYGNHDWDRWPAGQLDADGNISVMYGRNDAVTHANKVVEQIPGTTHPLVEEDEWEFKQSSVVPWQKGSFGKAIYRKDGSMQAWATDKELCGGIVDGQPWHDTMAGNFRWDEYYSLVIDPDGNVSNLNDEQDEKDVPISPEIATLEIAKLIGGKPNQQAGGYFKPEGADEWHFGAEQSWITPPWSKGEYGKFIITPKGDVHHWSVGQDFDGFPHHSIYADNHPDIDRSDLMKDMNKNEMQYTVGWITPKGEVITIDDCVNSPKHLPMLYDATGTKPDPTEEWDFNSKTAYEFGESNNPSSDWYYDHENVEPWEPGSNGKFITMPDGKLHHWKTQQYGAPHHMQYAMNFLGESVAEVATVPEGAVQGYIKEDGRINQYGGTPELQDVAAQHFKQYEQEDLDEWDFDGPKRTTLATTQEMYEPWTPGSEGKFLVSPDNEIHHWKVDGSGSPHHFEYGEDADIDFDGLATAPRGWTQGYLQPEGTYDTVYESYPGHKDVVEQELGVTPWQKPEWEFGAKTASGIPNRSQPWKRDGMHGGKFLVTPEGEVHHWQVDMRGNPHHSVAMRMLGLDTRRVMDAVDGYTYGYITKEGRVNSEGPNPEPAIALLNLKQPGEDVDQWDFASSYRPNASKSPKASSPVYKGTVDEQGKARQTSSNNRQTPTSNHQRSGTRAIHPWTLGAYGKWIITPDNKVHHWKDRGEEGPAYAIHHHDYLERMGLDREGWEHWPAGYIDPDGSIQAAYGERQGEAEAQVIQQVPGTHLGERGWDFTSSVRPNKGWLLPEIVDTQSYGQKMDFGKGFASRVASDPEHILEWEPPTEPWEPGKRAQLGRAIVTNRGQVVTWGGPEHHFEHAKAKGFNPMLDIRTFHYIHPDGSVTPSGNSIPGQEADANLISSLLPVKANPVSEISEDEWEFASRVAAMKPWVQGEGKFVVTPEGVHSWETGKFGRPFHNDVLEMLGIHIDQSHPFTYGYINVDGSYEFEGSQEDADNAAEQLGLKSMKEEDQWYFGKTANHDEHHRWTPGEHGKGFVLADGRPVTWNTAPELFEDDSKIQYYGPHHGDVTEKMGLSDDPVNNRDGVSGDWHTPVYIHPDGQFETMDYWPEAKQDATEPFESVGLSQKVQTPEEEWDFASRVAGLEDSGLDPWEPGDAGRAIILRDGTIHSWSDGDDNWSESAIYHYDGAAMLGVSNKVVCHLYIGTSGNVNGGSVEQNEAVRRTLPLPSNLAPELRDEDEDEWGFNSKTANEWDFETDHDEPNGWKFVGVENDGEFDVYMKPHLKSEPAWHADIISENNLGHATDNCVYGAISPDFGVEFYSHVDDYDVKMYLREIKKQGFAEAHYVEGYEFGERIAATWAGSESEADPTDHELPVVYDGNELLIGHPGLHHHQIRNDSYDHYTGLIADGLLSWFGKGTPENWKDLEKEAGEHVGQSLTTEHGNKWTFGKTAKAAITPKGCRPWVMGANGRYLVDSDRNVYSWIGEDAHHEDIIDQYGMDAVDGGYITPRGKKDPWFGPEQSWVFGRNVGDRKLPINVTDNVDGVRPWHHYVKTRDGKYHSAEGHHEWIIRDGGIQQEDIAGMGGKASDGHVWELDEHGIDLRNNWVFGKGNTPWQEGDPLEPWQPGVRGKGMMYNGEPHMWAVNDQWNGPHHGDAAYVIDPEERHEPQGYFHIDREGVVESEGGFDMTEFVNHDPRLKPAARGNEWEFTAAVEPPEFVHTNLHPDDSMYQDWDEHNEHAIIYDHTENKVYVGKPRIHHHDLQDEFGLAQDDDEKWQAHGDVVPNGRFVNHWGFEHHPEVEQHIRNYFDAHKREPDDEWGWDFTSRIAGNKPPPIADFAKLNREMNFGPYATDPEKVWQALQMGWTPGKEGKGLLTDDGDLYTWNTWDDDGNPHHFAICGVLEAGGIRCRNPDYIEAIFSDGECEASVAIHSQIKEQDPRLTPVLASWEFG